MLREADEKDKLVWVRLNKEFMNFEIQDGVCQGIEETGARYDFYD